MKKSTVGEKLAVIAAWRNSSDVESIWVRTTSYIREATREVLGF